MTTPFRSRRAALAVFAAFSVATSAQAGDTNLPPFDFSDAFYIANGIDPMTIIGRPNGTPPNSILDDTPNGADFNNVRMLSHTAAFDDSGHPIFFYVTGLPTLASFLDNEAGEEAFEAAEEFKVYEFPRAGNPPFAVFPKRQDLIADLSGGYFSNDPLGLWQINLVRFTPAAFDTDEGQEVLAELAARNGLDLDGTPVIRTKGEVESLLSDGFVSIETPPIGGPDFRWFFCPVIEDPDDGAIAPDAFLEIVELEDGTPLPAELEIFELFHCLQTTGDECDGDGFPGSISSVCSGSALPCPCGNAPSGATGCVNSTGQGGLLAASGTARVSADSVVLHGSQMPNQPVLYFQGNAQLNQPFGDGVRCAGESVVRLATKQNVGGASSFPAAGDPSLPTAGNVEPGQTRYYQAWYRDPSAFCTGDTFNLTNGVRIVWGI